MLHMVLFLQGFDQLRVEGLLCDVTLVPGDGDEVFPVHRAMMASASDYFKAMFTGGASLKVMPAAISKLPSFGHSNTCSVLCELAQHCKQIYVVVLSLLLHMGF